jgi:hypothetical protein
VFVCFYTNEESITTALPVNKYDLQIFAIKKMLLPE